MGGNLFIFTGPSGSGKGTVLAKVLEKDSRLKFSISATTRPMRTGEIDGKDYFFLTEEKFKKIVNEHGFLEYACYQGAFYGTPKVFTEEQLEKGFDVILEIEVQGAMQIKQKTDDGIFIFFCPSSVSALKERLLKRGTETAEQIEKRITTALEELKFIKDFDYLVINDDVEEAVSQLASIILAERRRIRHLDLTKELEVIKN